MTDTFQFRPHLIARLAKMGYYEWDEKNELYLDVSAEYAAMFGVSREVFLETLQPHQESDLQWVHPDDREHYVTQDQYYAANPQEYSIEYRLLKPKGDFRYVIETGEPVKDERGQVTKWFGIIQDITDRVLREQERETTLRNAVAVAENANHAKTEFLASMSHELRTPMNAVLGFSQLMASDPENPISDIHRHYIQLVLENGQHLMSLIDQVLDLAQIETGHLPMTIQDLDAQAAIDECFTFVLPLAQERHITLVSEPIPAVPWRCRAYTGLLRQVLLNLVSNAIKYNVDGGSVQVGISEQASQTVRLSVTDTGRGIPVENQKKMFEPFNRLGLEASNIRGTGIGLTIVKQLTERMNGTVGFESTPDVGSTFWIELPSKRPQ